MRFVEVGMVPGFTSELIRAANEVERLRAEEVRALLFRAIATVSELREQVGIPGSGTPLDAVVELNATAVDAERRSGKERSAALLEAADLIRTLWVVFDSGVAISLIPTD